MIEEKVRAFYFNQENGEEVDSLLNATPDTQD